MSYTETWSIATRLHGVILQRAVSFVVTKVRTTNPKLQLSSNCQSVQRACGSTDEIHVIFPDLCHPSSTLADKLAVPVRCCARHCPVPATSGSVPNTTWRYRQRLYQNKTSWYRQGQYNWTDLLPPSAIQNVSLQVPPKRPAARTALGRPMFQPPHVHAAPRSTRHQSRNVSARHLSVTSWWGYLV